MPNLRRAEMRDLIDIMRVVREAQAFMRTLDIDQWQDGYPGEDILRRDIVIGQLYVIEDGGSIAAFAALSLLPELIYDTIDGAWRAPGKYLTIHRMAIDDAHRGGGSAAQILDKAYRLARENQCDCVRADTHRGNRAMRRFLEKNGFALCGEVSYPVDAGDPIRVAYDCIVPPEG